MARKWIILFVAGSFLLPAWVALGYGATNSDSDEAPVLAPNRSLPSVPLFTDEITWTVGANMPTTRYSAVTGTYGGEIFVAIGRHSDAAPYNTAVCEAYNYGANTWRTNCTSAPTARRMPAFGAMYEGDFLYTVGGRAEPSTTVGTLEIYNMATNQWTTGPACLPRWAHGGAVLNGYVYVFGSDGALTPNTSAQRYNIGTNTWETIAALPGGDGWVCGAAAAGKVYCIGGSSNTTRMLEYDPATNQWTTRAPIPHARTYSTAITHNNLIYVVGGMAPSGNLVDVYDPATNSWAAETNTPSTICWEAMGVSESAIYSIGGTPQSTPIQYLNQVWIGALQAPETGTLEGIVAEAAGGHDPIEGAAVALAGDTVYTDVQGYYTFTDINAGTYDVTASAFGYNPLMHSVVIVAGQTTTQNFALTQPVISVDVTEFDIDLAVGDVHNETFNISNLGDGDLTFDIDVNLGGGGPGIETILLVDDDGGPNNGGTYQDVQSVFVDALEDAGFAYDVFIVDWSITTPPQNGPTLAEMQGYDLVIWFTGETWGYYGDDTLTMTDESNLADYLDGGGHLFLSGQDYLWESYPAAGPFSPGQFPYDYLGVTSATQDLWQPPTSAIGGAGSVAAGMTFVCTVPYPSATLWCDQILNNGTTVFLADGQGPAACQKTGNTFKTVFTTLSFEGLVDGAPPSTKAQFMTNMIAWMGETLADQVQTPPRPALEPVSSTNPAAKTVSEYTVNAGTGPIARVPAEWSGTDEPWLVVHPGTGTVLPQESQLITATFEMPDTAEVGEDYSGEIVINNNSVQSPVTIPVSVHIVSAIGDNFESAPQTYALHQNYPNPFNPVTNIRFDLRQSGHVNLAIYNVLGQKVATLVDRNLEAGNHTVTFNGSSLASGVYFYRIEAGQFSDMKKMVLMK